MDFALLRLVKHPEGQEIPTERETPSRAPHSRATTAGDLQKQTCPADLHHSGLQQPPKWGVS